MEDLSGLRTTSIWGNPGYWEGMILSESEVQEIRSLIRNHYLNRLRAGAPEFINCFETRDLDRYHEASSLIDHSSFWSKSSRILPHESARKIRELPFISTLRSKFGDFTISGEEGIQKEEFYWRLVRPNMSSDVGPIHADSWFWDLNQQKIPPSHKRVKVWIALFNEPGEAGFHLFPNSHKTSKGYITINRNGRLKPAPKETLLDTPTKISSPPGHGVVFHDDLLHGGFTGGKLTRVSVEFTMLVNASKIPKSI